MTGQIIIIFLLTVISVFTTNVLITVGSLAAATALALVVEGFR